MMPGPPGHGGEGGRRWRVIRYVYARKGVLAYLPARYPRDAVHPKGVALDRSKCFAMLHAALEPCCRRLNRVGEVNNTSLASFVAKILRAGRAVGWGRVGLTAPTPDLVCFPVRQAG